MLFYLTNSLIVDSKDPEFRDIYYSIENLIKAYEERQHMVMGDYEVLRWFSNFFTDDNPKKSVLLHILNSFSTTTVPTVLTEYVKVVKESDGIIEEDDKIVYLTNYYRFTNSRTLEATRIIGEDDNDANFYEQVSRWYRVKNQIPFNIEVRFEQGGGNRTHKKVKTHKDLKNIFVGIVDTDQKYPGGETGRTCNDCCKLSYTHPFERLYMIHAHEVENLIPISILDELTWTIGNRHTKTYYDSIWTNLKDYQTAWQFCDLKSGIKKLVKYKNDPNWKSFVERIYDANSHKKRSFLEKFSNAQDDGEILSGLSSSILSDSVEVMKAKSDENLIKIDKYLPYQLNEWNQIGQLVLNMGISSSREGVNLL